jgi:hypothetical protein
MGQGPIAVLGANGQMPSVADVTSAVQRLTA